MSGDPASLIAALDAQCQRHETPFAGGRLVWRSWGAGAPVVLIHGAIGSWTHWIRNIGPLARRYQVWAVDAPGSGESDLAPVDGSLAPITAALTEGIDHLIPAPWRFNLVGFSLGGRMSAAVTEVLQQRIDCSVFVGSSMAQQNKQIPMLRVRGVTDPVEITAINRENLGRLMLAHRDRIDDLAVHIQTQNGLRTRLVRGTYSRRDTTPVILARLKSPLRIAGIWGDLDPGTELGGQGEVEAMRKVAPQAKTFVIKDAGHWVMYEAADAFNAALLEALQP